jgi:dipeptidyl aminopeptidase/acylaminoacyl peptidase
MQPFPINFTSGGEQVCGKFFKADGRSLATLLLIPGWPGNPDDVLTLGSLLSPKGLNVMMFNPRGFWGSGGTNTNAKTLEDIGAGWKWLHREDVRERFSVDPNQLILGGYSYGGGMALAYAGRKTTIRQVISIAGNDHGELVRLMQQDSKIADQIRSFLKSTQTPEGPCRFDLEYSLQEFRDHPEIFGLKENAASLAGRSILLMGGWEDEGVSAENILLPFYRALKAEGAIDVTFLMYHADHSFSSVRERMAEDIFNWITREPSTSPGVSQTD